MTELALLVAAAALVLIWIEVRAIRRRLDSLSRQPVVVEVAA